MIQKPAAAVHLSEAALDWALTHLRRFGDTVFLPRAFEYDAIDHDWARVKTWLSAKDMREWSPRPYRRFLAAKTIGSFRYVTQLDPIEHLAFAGLIYDLGRELETFRLPVDERVVFSWRFAPQPDGTMYDPNFRWSDFNERCSELAKKKSVKYVVVADIADFFPHLYLHPLERTLDRCTRTSAQAYCVLRILKGWNARVSYGVPVGPPSSRILADSTLAELDEALIGSGARYCRYSDDFRIFCRTEAEAHTRLEFLAENLFESYGLTLQSTKTVIVTATEYRSRFTMTAERLETESLEEKLHDLLEEAGIEAEYDEELNYDELSDDVKEKIDKLNLAELFRLQLHQDRYDPILMSILLQRLGQLDQEDVLDDVIDNLQKLEPIIDAVVRYLSTLRSISEKQRHRIGKRIVRLVKNKTSSRYQVACLLSIFSYGTEFNNDDAFERLYEILQDEGKRELVLALGRAGKQYWFVSRRRDSAALAPWLRRAFLAGASCMRTDVRDAFFKTAERSEDILEQAVLAWVRAHPFS